MTSRARVRSSLLSGLLLSSLVTMPSLGCIQDAMEDEDVSESQSALYTTATFAALGTEGYAVALQNNRILVGGY